MRKKLFQVIESCRDCPHFIYEGWEHWCEHPDSPDFNLIENEENIPSWCPLEDDDEGTL